MADPDVRRRIVYQVAGMEAAAARRDLVYQRDGNEQLLMDVYPPTRLARDARAPALLFVHGGPVSAEMQPPKDWGVFVSYAQLAATSGLVGVTFNHRLHSPADYARSQAEVAAAIEYVRSHADELQVDPQRIGLWVFSGGGPLLSSALREPPPYLCCVVAFYALLDLRHLAPPDADAETLARVQELSPAVQVSEKLAGLPMFIARAGLDSEMINRSVDQFVQDAVAANALLDFANHPQGQHAFDVLNDDARSREIIARAVAFVRTHLRVASL